jgi:hypothetical protein
MIIDDSPPALIYAYQLLGIADGSCRGVQNIAVPMARDRGPPVDRHRQNCCKNYANYEIIPGCIISIQ